MSQFNKHICPECGGPKGCGSKTCIDCYRGSERQKRILHKATDAATKANTGRVKDPKRFICPECGGRKSRNAQTCQQCYFGSERHKQVLKLAHESYALAVARGEIVRTPEQRERYGQVSLERWADHPEWREQMSERNRELWEAGILKTYERTPEIRERNSQSKLGHTASLEARFNMSVAAASRVPNFNFVRGEYHSPIAGKFAYQSSYELRFAKVLDRLGWQWEQNRDRFSYSKKGGATGHYTPDFKVVAPGQLRYYETKGYFRQRDQLKVRQVQLKVPIIVLTLPLLEMFERLGCATHQDTIPKK